MIIRYDKRLLLPVALLAILVQPGCDKESPASTASWPLTCDYVSFDTVEQKLARCAQRDTRGELVIRPDLLADIAPQSGVQTIHANGQWLFATSDTTMPALAYDNGADYFEQGLARTVRKGKIGFVDQNLDIVIEPEWDFAMPFEGGYAAVCRGCRRVPDGEHTSLQGGLWGYISLDGQVVIEAVHDRDSLPMRPD